MVGAPGISIPFPKVQMASANAALFASRGSPGGSNSAGGVLQSSYLKISAVLSANTGQLVPMSTRTLVNSYPCQLVPMSTRTHVN